MLEPDQGARAGSGAGPGAGTGAGTGAGSNARLRAELRVGGVTVAAQQLALALALECERVVCLTRAGAVPMAALQQASETGGARFHAIAEPRALLGLVTAADDVVLFADGLFAAPELARAALGGGQAVLVQPIEAGLEAGFERIDLNHAGAGAMRLPGYLIARIAELPEDCDVFSALQRIALQAGIVQRAVLQTGLPAASDGSAATWQLLRCEADALALEPGWVRAQTAEAGALSPSRGLALRLVRGFGPALIEAGSGPGVIAIAAIVLALWALGTAWFGLAPLGLAIAALAWVMRQAAALLTRLAPAPGANAGKLRWVGSEGLFGWGLDALLVLLAGQAAHAPGEGLAARLFAPLMLMVLVRLLATALPPRWRAWCDDRSLNALALAALVLSPGSGLVLRGAAAALALLTLALMRGRKTGQLG